MKSEFPKITIVTPNLNQCKYLEQTILSVLKQQYPNLEYIIIDGGSTDSSLDIIKKYESSLSWWISEPDNGMYHAIQKGFEKSTGEIMAWINSDDMYHPGSFSTVAEIFSTLKEVNWIIGIATMFDNDGRTLFVDKSYPFTRFDFLVKNYCWIQQESSFWRRSLWDRSGAKLNTYLRLAGDFDLWMKFFRHDRPYIVDALVGGIRVRGDDQLTQNFMNIYMDEIKEILSNEPLSSEEIGIIKKYSSYRKWNNFLSKLPFYNNDIILNRFKGKFFLPSKRIKFDFELSKFYLE